MAALPTEDEVIGYITSLSNWGRWGPDDELGTINTITPKKRVEAAGLVKEGISVSCAWDIENTHQPDHAFSTPQRFMVASGEGWHDPQRVGLATGRMGGAIEYFGLVFHGYAITHVDALGHIFWEGQMYNGKPQSLVSTFFGATHQSVLALREGIVTRGVLLDVAATKGVPWLEPGYGVTPEDIAAAEQRQGVQVGPGDVALLRTGYGRKRRELGREPLPNVPQAGWHAASLPWMRERDVAMIGSDTAQDMSPSPYPALPIPVHIVGIVGMGLYLIDNMDLEALAQTCERLGRWEFQFVLSPLRVIGGTGSPANPLAVF